MQVGNKNAVKHGMFSKIAIFPEEDAAEFEAHHKELIVEWDPQGPTEHDVVFTLAVDMWRKLRMRRWRWATFERASRIEKQRRRRDEKETDALIDILGDIEDGKTLSEKDLAKKLPYGYKDHFAKNFSRKGFESDEAWLKSVDK